MLAVLHSPVFEPPPCASERTGFGSQKGSPTFAQNRQYAGYYSFPPTNLLYLELRPNSRFPSNDLTCQDRFLEPLESAHRRSAGVELLGVEEHVDVDKEDVDAETFNLRPQLS